MFFDVAGFVFGIKDTRFLLPIENVRLANVERFSFLSFILFFIYVYYYLCRAYSSFLLFSFFMFHFFVFAIIIFYLS